MLLLGLVLTAAYVLSLFLALCLSLALAGSLDKCLNAEMFVQVSRQRRSSTNRAIKFNFCRFSSGSKNAAEVTPISMWPPCKVGVARSAYTGPCANECACVNWIIWIIWIICTLNFTLIPFGIDIAQSERSQLLFDWSRPFLEALAWSAWSSRSLGNYRESWVSKSNSKPALLMSRALLSFRWFSLFIQSLNRSSAREEGEREGEEGKRGWRVFDPLINF